MKEATVNLGVSVLPFRGRGSGLEDFALSFRQAGDPLGLCSHARQLLSSDCVSCACKRRVPLLRGTG